MKATVILLLIIALLYFMKVISFDFELLKIRMKQFKNWCIKTYNLISKILKSILGKKDKTQNV